MNKYIVNSQMQKCDKHDSGSCYGSDPQNQWFVSDCLKKFENFQIFMNEGLLTSSKRSSCYFWVKTQ